MMMARKARTRQAPTSSGNAATDVCLAAIWTAQQSKWSGYTRARAEMEEGRKTGHWIWYVWPTLRALRPGTSRKDCLLPDLHAAHTMLHAP